MQKVGEEKKRVHFSADFQRIFCVFGGFRGVGLRNRCIYFLRGLWENTGGNLVLQVENTCSILGTSQKDLRQWEMRTSGKIQMMIWYCKWKTLAIY